MSRILKLEAVYGVLWVESYSQSVHDAFREFQIDVMGLHPNSVSKTDTYLIMFFITLGRGKQVNFTCGEIEPETIFFTRSEIDMLEAVELGASYFRVRDSFLFSCFTGLR